MLISEFCEIPKDLDFVFDGDHRDIMSFSMKD